MVKPISLYLVFTCFNPYMVLYFPLLLRAWADLKYIFLGFVCRKGIPFTKKQSVSSSIFGWFWAIREVKSILGMVLWCSGILMVALTCMVSIWGSYMASDLLMLLVVIGQFLIWFFWMDSFKVCVDGHPTSCCNILALSAPLIYCLRNHELLLSTLLRNL